MDFGTDFIVTKRSEFDA